jgi:hypothetical protein
MKDGHEFLRIAAAVSHMVAGGGPVGCRARGRELPDKYMPGRFWQNMNREQQQAVLLALKNPPALWFLKQIILGDR